MDTTQLFSLKGRTALITGGSRGIGRMIAEGFLAQGARVYISARKAAACDQTAKELSAFGHCVSLPADVSTVEGAQKLVEAYAKHEGSLDILVNNAGAAWGAPYAEFPESGWDKVVDLNLKTPFFLTQALTPMLKKAATDHLAKVINIASIDGISVNPQETYSYAASKAGLIQLTRRMALRLAQERIVGHEQGCARPRRRGQGPHSGRTHRRAGRHGRRGHLPGLARGRLRDGFDAGGGRRRHARALTPFPGQGLRTSGEPLRP